MNVFYWIVWPLTIIDVFSNNHKISSVLVDNRRQSLFCFNISVTILLSPMTISLFLFFLFTDNVVSKSPKQLSYVSKRTKSTFVPIDSRCIFFHVCAILQMLISLLCIICICNKCNNCKIIIFLLLKIVCLFYMIKRLWIIVNLRLLSVLRLQPSG